MKLFLLFLISTISLIGFSKTILTETNETSNQSVWSDTTLINSYLDLSEFYLDKNLDSAEYFCLQVKAISDKHITTSKSKSESKLYELFLSDALGNLSVINHRTGNFDISLKLQNKSLFIRKKHIDLKRIANCLNNLSVLYQDLGKIEKATTCLYQSLSISESLNDLGSIATIKNNLSTLYNGQNNIDFALKLQKEALQIRLTINDNKGVANSYHNLAIIYRKCDSINTALKLNFKALELRKQEQFNKGIADSYNSIAIIYGQLKKHTISAAYLDSSIAVNIKIKNNRGLCVAYVNLASVYLKQKQVDLANINANKSLSIAKEINYPKAISKSSFLLTDINKINGDFEIALEMYELHIKMRDSIYNINTQKAAIQQEINYKYEKQKVIDDLKNTNQLVLEKKEKEKHKMFTQISIFIGLLIIVFSITLYKRLRITRKQKKLIENQKIEVENQKEIIEESHKEITDSINYTKRLQKAILPRFSDIDLHLPNNFVLFQPKDIVSGDFYWLEKIENGVLFAVADCTGHGVPGAMVSVICNNALNRSVREFGLTDPGQILDKTRDIIIDEFKKSDESVKDGMDITICNLTENKLLLSGANNPLWLIRNNEIIITKTDKQPVGNFDLKKPFNTHQIDLEKNDQFYIFSDGYADQFGGTKGKKFKTTELKKLILAIHKLDLKEQKNILIQTINEWRKDIEQLDDICIMGIRI